MNKVYEKLMRCYESVRTRISFQPEIALVLGSGLGDYGEQIRTEAVLDYSQIDGFPVSTAPGHKGRFLFGYVNEVPVVVMQGRVHYYEGYPMTDVVLPIRLMGMMGAKVLFLTNASGGVNLSFHPGDLMMITGQIASFVPSPLIGPNLTELGSRFPDMSQIYRKDLCGIIRSTAQKLSLPLQEGTYLQFTGPAYESPEEIRMARLLGADAVGMSTACEAVTANHLGMEVCGISCITNMACGILDQPLSEEEVLRTGAQVAETFSKLVTESIIAIHGARKKN